MNWVIIENKTVTKQLSKVPKNIQANYSYWRNLIKHNGVQSLRDVSGFNYKKLEGKREGQHVCRLSRGYRVFFEVHKGIITVNVLEVNNHDY